jgi:hypothetical protein
MPFQQLPLPPVSISQGVLLAATVHVDPSFSACMSVSKHSAVTFAHVSAAAVYSTQGQTAGSRQMSKLPTAAGCYIVHQ